MRRILIISLLWCIQTDAQVAIDSVTPFDMVQIRSSEIHDLDKLISSQILETNPGMSYAELLQKQSNLYIKSQGNGVLNTPSFQGYGSRHIPIYLNGFNMQSGMNGTMDLSLISAFHFTSSQFQQNSPNDLGSPSLGPSLKLSSKSIPGVSVFTGVSSLTQAQLGFKHLWLGNRYVHDYSIQGSFAPNAYKIDHYSGTDENERLTNSQFQNYSLMHRIANLNHKKIKWRATSFVQYADRQIPSSLLVEGDSRQVDLNAMIGNQFTFIKLKNIQLKNQIWREQIDFISPRLQVDSRSINYSINTTLTKAFHFFDKSNEYSPKTLSIGLANENYFYEADDILADADQFRVRGFASYSASRRNIKYGGNAQVQPFQGELYTSANLHVDRLIKRWLIGLEASKMFNLPTLNDYFWFQPGTAVGNPNLQAETGYRSQVNIRHTTQTRLFKLEPFIGISDNLIQWLPEASVWSPINQNRVRLMGASALIQQTWKMFNARASIRINQSYTNAKYIFEASHPQHNKQLIFTPQYVANATFSLAGRALSWYANMQYVGKNYTSTDNLDHLESYILFETGASIGFKKARMSLVAKNLTNQAYFTVPNNTLPGFHFNLNYTYRIK